MADQNTLPSPKKATAGIAHYRPERYIVAPFEILTDPQLTDGDRKKTAEILGISYKTLYNKTKKYKEEEEAP